MKNILNHFIVLFLGLFPAIAWGQGMYINFHDGTSEFQHLDNVKKLKVENDYSDFNDKLKFYFYAPDSHRNCLTLGPSEQTIECKIYTIGNDGHHTYNRKLHIDQPWIRVDDIDGEVMTISVKRNLTDKIRVGTIKLTEENKKSVYDVLTIKQGCNGASDISGTVDGHEYVDLGLPSGLLWAKLNVGAARPGERGGHFAFGETETRERDSYTSASYWDKFKPAGGSDLLSFIFPDNDQYAISYYGTSRIPGAYVKMTGSRVLKIQAYSLTSRKMKKFRSRTPFIWARKIFTLELNASAEALVARRLK